MDVSGIAGIEAFFTNGKERCTTFSLKRGESEVYDVKMTASRSHHEGLNLTEFVERHGSFTSWELGTYLAPLKELDLTGWYHHYPAVPGWNRYLSDDTPRAHWSIRVRHQDECLEQWEGLDTAPPGLVDLYIALLKLGMPNLNQGYYGTFSNYCKRLVEEEDCLLCLLRDVTLMERTCPPPDQLEENAEFAQLVAEFAEDLQTYLKEYRLSHDSDSMLGSEGVSIALEPLFEHEVAHASKGQICLLMEALLRVQDLPQAVVKGMEAQALKRWIERLRAIPGEERDKQRRREEEAREKTRQRIDDAIRARIERHDTQERFTASDLAQELDVPSSQVNGRLRTMQFKDKLIPITDVIPRQYRVA